MIRKARVGGRSKGEREEKEREYRKGKKKRWEG